MAQIVRLRAGTPKCLGILVADDNEMLRTAVRGLLTGFGHSVDLVVNGREAVEAAVQYTYDLIFLDIQMPEMGGGSKQPVRFAHPGVPGIDLESSQFQPSPRIERGCRPPGWMISWRSRCGAPTSRSF